MAGAPPLHPVALKLRLQHPCRDSVPAPCQRGVAPLDTPPKGFALWNPVF